MQAAHASVLQYSTNVLHSTSTTALLDMGHTFAGCHFAAHPLHQPGKKTHRKAILGKHSQAEPQATLPVAVCIAEQTCQTGDAVASSLEAHEPSTVLKQIPKPRQVFKAEVYSYIGAQSSWLGVAVTLEQPLCQGNPCVGLSSPCRQKKCMARGGRGLVMQSQNTHSTLFPA